MVKGISIVALLFFGDERPLMKLSHEGAAYAKPK